MNFGLFALFVISSLVSAAAVPAENGHENGLENGRELNARGIEIVITSTPQEAEHKLLEHEPISALACGNCPSYSCAYFDGANYFCLGIDTNPNCPDWTYLSCEHRYPPYYCRAKSECTKDESWIRNPYRSPKVPKIIHPAIPEVL